MPFRLSHLGPVDSTKGLPGVRAGCGQLARDAVGEDRLAVADREHRFPAATGANFAVDVLESRGVVPKGQQGEVSGGAGPEAPGFGLQSQDLGRSQGDCPKDIRSRPRDWFGVVPRPTHSL